jgi:hypothetical protein
MYLKVSLRQNLRDFSFGFLHRNFEPTVGALLSSLPANFWP